MPLDPADRTSREMFGLLLLRVHTLLSSKFLYLSLMPAFISLNISSLIIFIPISSQERCHKIIGGRANLKKYRKER